MTVRAWTVTLAIVIVLVGVAFAWFLIATADWWVVARPPGS